jgi:hypothetical protein
MVSQAMGSRTTLTPVTSKRKIFDLEQDMQDARHNMAWGTGKKNRTRISTPLLLMREK